MLRSQLDRLEGSVGSRGGDRGAGGGSRSGAMAGRAPGGGPGIPRPWESSLEELYCPAAGTFDLGRNRRRGLTIQRD